MHVEEIEQTTCSTLREFAKNRGIKVKDTKRLFWGQYGYYLKAPINPKWIEDRHQEMCDFWDKTKVMPWKDAQPSHHQIARKFKARVNKHIDRFIEKNAEAFDADEFYSQVTSERMSFYVKSAETALYLLKNNRKFFNEISAPTDVVVENRLHDYADTHMQVREHLWFARFDYKVDFKKERSFEALDERVDRLFLTDSFYSIAPYTRTLYLAGEDEYFLVKLALKDKIASVQTCVQNSEASGEIVKKCI